MPPKAAPSPTIIFQVLHKTWYLSHLTSPEKILSILKDLSPSKAADIDNLSGKLLKDGPQVLARPVS